MAAQAFVHTQDAETIHFFGTRMRILVSGEQTQGAFCLLEVRSPAGNATPPHVHHRETETIHLLEGKITCVLDGKPVAVTTGETVVLPPDVPHQLINGDQDVRSLLMCTPAGFDGFVRAAGTATPVAPTPEGTARAVAVAATFGIEIFTG
jgi:quercetin dioxygenase-like cupin family protein